MLIEAVGRLINSGYDLNLEIFGPDENKYEQRLRNMISIGQWNDRIKLCGATDNPYSFMRKADIYVQPSRIESYGITLREAQILGCPILTTSTDGAIENIEHKITGYICDVSTDGIRDGIVELINDKSLREQLSANCKCINFDDMNRREIDKLCALLE